MKVLIGCEFSGVVREAFRTKGIDAWSCDLLPSSDNSRYHIQCDVLEIIDDGWDLGIFHPPCTHLAVSGAPHFYKKEKEQAESLEFVGKLMSARISKICIENPVGIISTKIRKPDQIIQPWMFGHTEQKKTCLWLKNLSPLKSTNIVWDEMLLKPRYLRERLHYMSPSKNRGQLRSITFSGIAKAMADQWGS